MRLNAAIKSKSIYLLYLLPFIVAAVIFVYSLTGGVYTPCFNSGIISLPFFDAGGGMKELGAFVLLALSFFLFFISDRFKFLPSTTVLPAFFYCLLTIGIFCRYGLNAYLVAAFCTALSVWRLQSAIVHTKTNAPVFDFGFFIALTVLLCPNLVMLIPWAILVLPFSGRATLKDMVALFMGFFVPVILVGSYYFWQGSLVSLPDRFMEIMLSGDRFVDLIGRHPLPFVVFSLLMVVSLMNVLLHYQTSIVSQRRGMLSMVSLLLFVGSSIFFIPFSCHGVMYILAIPQAYLFAQYFISHRMKWMGNILFLILLVACALFIFY